MTIAKLSEGDTISMTGEVTLVHDDGTVTVRLHGYDVPVTTRGEDLSLIAKKRAEPGRRKKLFDVPDRSAGASLSTEPYRHRLV